MEKTDFQDGKIHKKVPETSCKWENHGTFEEFPLTENPFCDMIILLGQSG